MEFGERKPKAVGGHCDLIHGSERVRTLRFSRWRLVSVLGRFFLTTVGSSAKTVAPATAAAIL